MTAGARERRLAFAVCAVSAVAFALAVAYARMPWPRAPAFIAAYEAALVISDFITAILLFGQFAQLRSRALLALACGYLFDALMIVPHALSFPELFSQTGLLGAGSQTTAWLYMFWHGGFPLFVLAYVLFERRDGGAARDGKAATNAGSAILATLGVAGVFTLMATVGEAALPALIVGNVYTPIMHVVVFVTWSLSVIALLALLRRSRSVLDLWLSVVMCAWIFDIGMSAVFNAGRYDLGFYAGRIYGLLAASFVLVVLLLETSGLYSRLARQAEQLVDQTQQLRRDVRNRISVQAQTEAQLRQAQKMEAIGNLTGGMAHDFNNLLGIIIGNLDILQSSSRRLGEGGEFVEEALDAALRGADLTRRLLAFARRQPLRPERLEVNALVEGIVKLLTRTLGEDIEVELDLAQAVAPVVADPAQLEAALTNLATNARDAMPGGGRLIIATGNRTLDDEYAAVHPEVTPGDYAMIEVSDTGTGMPAEIASRIFEPFFTTKEAGKGTGLGLSMVYGYMKQSGGHIGVYSEPGVGTTFRLYLPQAAAAAKAAAAPAASAAPAQGSETVLVVEDNAAMRRIAVRQLKELGYRVLESDSAAAALEVLDRETVDLLFTDVVMPGAMKGTDLARAATTRRPALKIVFTSGFPEAKLNGSSEPVVGMPLLSKPYRKAELAQIVRKTMDA